MTLVWENDHANAIFDVWFGGTEAGNAIADVLFGNYNPSGKLTTSFPEMLDKFQFIIIIKIPAGHSMVKVFKIQIELSRCYQ